MKILLYEIILHISACFMKLQLWQNEVGLTIMELHCIFPHFIIFGELLAWFLAHRRWAERGEYVLFSRDGQACGEML